MSYQGLVELGLAFAIPPSDNEVVEKFSPDPDPGDAENNDRKLDGMTESHPSSWHHFITAGNEKSFSGRSVQVGEMYVTFTTSLRSTAITTLNPLQKENNVPGRHRNSISRIFRTRTCPWTIFVFSEDPWV